MRLLDLVLAIGGLLVVAGCSNGDAAASQEQSWWAWHAEKRDVDRVVDDAISEPGGGDYAKAADAIRSSSRPAAVKQFEIGQLVVGGITRNAGRRPPETLEQGLRMMEDSAVAPGHEPRVAAQQLRILFERGAGAPPHAFPKNAEVAACWLAVEEKRSEDSARCIALRRQRLPNIGG